MGSPSMCSPSSCCAACSSADEVEVVDVGALQVEGDVRQDEGEGCVPVEAGSGIYMGDAGEASEVK